jgi:hypothetical protein
MTLLAPMPLGVVSVGSVASFSVIPLYIRARSCHFQIIFGTKRVELLAVSLFFCTFAAINLKTEHDGKERR